MSKNLIFASLCIASFCYIFVALGFKSNFIVDPIGPRAFPLGIGIGLLILSGVLVKTSNDKSSFNFNFQQTAFVFALCIYAIALPRVTFVLATTILAASMIILFEGPWRVGLLLSFFFSVLIYALFVFVLGVSLPGV